MKKTFACLVVLSLAGLASVQAAVYSNVVGVITIPAPQAGQLSIVALAQLAPENVHIQDAIANKASLNAGTAGNYAAADKIIRWTGSKYEEYGLFQPASGEPFWMSSKNPAWSVPGLAASAADVVLQRSDGVWFRTGAGQDSKPIVLAGNVPDDSAHEVSVVSGLNMLALPYSASINLKDLVVSNATASNNYAVADKIIRWTGTKYEEYGLFQPASGEPFWMSSKNPAWSVPGLAASAADVEIDIGLGFWYRSGAAKTISFSRPYSL